jgi:SAM-dependent methyltransferase
VFIDESLWLKRVLEGLKLGPSTRVLDIGSSSAHFRQVIQPHIDGNVYAPLRARQVPISHLDGKAEPGVDIVADVSTLDGVDMSFEVVICTNLLEHVVDLNATVRNICRVVAPQGTLILTVPRRYPIHHDPIDTAFRPTPEELAQLVGWPHVIEKHTLTVKDPAHYRGKRFIRRFVLPWQLACLVVQKP